MYSMKSNGKYVRVEKRRLWKRLSGAAARTGNKK